VRMILYLRGWNEMTVGHWEAKLGWVDNTVISMSDESQKNRPDIRNLGQITWQWTNRARRIGPDAKWCHEGKQVHQLTWHRSRIKIEVGQQSFARAKHINY
jgi:hypothetical protein